MNSSKTTRDIVSFIAGKCAICANFENKALANEAKIIKKKERADHNSLKYCTTADEKWT